jgi:uncharacterized protein
VLKRFTLICALLLFSSTIASAQNINDFLQRIPELLQRGQRLAAQHEWQRLLPSEASCIDAALQQQGNSINTLIENGIMPNDPRISGVRSGCRSTLSGPTQRDLNNLSSKPTFDCANARSLTARAICRDQAGAAADWDLILAYWARYFTLSESDRQAFDQAQQSWLDLLNQKCPRVQNSQECVLSAYHKRAAAYRSKIEGNALAESRLTPEQHAQIQQGLIALGLLDDTSDGEFGAKTRAAIQRFKTQLGAPEGDFLTAEQRDQLLQAKLTPGSLEAHRSWQLIDASVKSCVNTLLQRGGQNIEMLITNGVGASDTKVSPVLSECQIISSQSLMKNFACELNDGPTRCDEAYVLESAPTTPLTVEQVTTALLANEQFGKARIENPEARAERLKGIERTRIRTIADEALKKLRPLLAPDNEFLGKATELRTRIENARSSPATTSREIEALDVAASDLLNEYLRKFGNPAPSNPNMAKVSDEGFGTNENDTRINTFYDIFDKQLRELIGSQADGAIGQQFRKDANTSFDRFKADFFTSETKDNCFQRGTNFTCLVVGVFKLGSLKSKLQEIMRTRNYVFILDYRDTEDKPTLFLIDSIRAEFINFGYSIVAKSGEEEARRIGAFDYYVNILDVEYDDKASDVGSIGGGGTSVFENYILKARVKLLDNKKDPAARRELANVSVINTKRVPRDTTMPRQVRRDQLLPMQAGELAREIYRNVSAALENAKNTNQNGNAFPEAGHYSIRIVGLTERDREKIRALRSAVSRVLSGTETMVDPQGTNDKSVEIRFEYSGKFDPEDINDAIYEIFKGDNAFKIRYEGNNSFVGSL